MTKERSLYGDIEYDCTENENTLGFKMGEDSPTILDEMYVGCKFAPSAGVTVIGMKDLTKALERIGYALTKAGDAKFTVGGKPVEQIIVSRDNKEVIAVISNTEIIGHKGFQVDINFKEA